MNRDGRLRDIAIALRNYEPVPVGDYHTHSEWASAADYALDSDDWSELEWMLLREKEWLRYGQYSDQFLTAEGSFPPLDFDAWLERYVPTASRCLPEREEVL